jgi:arginine deiminase
VDSEVGRLRAVIVHRPGAELKRLVLRGSGGLPFAGLPWAARAQQEHDAGTKSLYRPGLEPLHGGDLLLAAPGVIAAGCPPPGAERLARRVFDAGLAHSVLVVPSGHADRRLDTACTMLSADTVLMRPAAAYSLTARVLTPGGGGPRVSHPQAFPAAAAAAAGLDRLRVVETGFGAAGGEQWDDAGNLLVLAPGLVVSHERNVATHARLERIGIELITVPGSELCGSRGGPRSLCCPVSRDPAPLPAD